MTLRVVRPDMFREVIDNLIDDLNGLKTPEIDHAMASPSDLERSGVAFLLNFASVVDAAVLDFGRAISARVPGGFSPKQMENFKDQLTCALEGNATFVLEDTAEGIREDFSPRRPHHA